MNNQVALGDLVTIKGGGTPSRNNPAYWGGSVPWATVKDLTSSVLSTTQESISTEAVKSSATNVIPAGAIITATRMGLGRAAINTVDIAINQDLKALQPKSNLDSRYLLHFLLSKASFIESMGKGATVKGILLEDLKQLQIPLPSLAEQKRIAAILDKADAIRRKRQAAIKLADNFLRATFFEMFGDPVTNSKGWGEQTLCEIADIVSGVTKGRKFNGKQPVLVPYMRVANIQDGHIDLTEIKEIEALDTDIQKYALKNGDILLTEGGDPDKLGRGAVWRGEVKLCIHQNHIFRVRVNALKVLPEYLSALIGSARGKRYFLKAAKQTTGIASINMTQLKAFPALLPPLDLQQTYADIVHKQSKLKESLANLSFQNNHLFNSLTQRAFRGAL